MKKIAVFLIIFNIILWGSLIVIKKIETREEPTLLEKIRSAETFEEITSCNSHIGESPETDEEKSEFLNKVKNYILNHKDEISDIYFYNQYFALGTHGYSSYGKYLYEMIAIYINGDDEIYIIPIENDVEIDVLDLSDIPSKEEYLKYKYNITSWDAGDETWNRGYSAISIDTVNVYNSEIELFLEYDEKNQRIEIYGSTPLRKDKSVYGRDYLPYGGMYYKSDKKSLEYAKKEYALLLRDMAVEDDEVNNYIPELYMFTDDVIKTKWGVPDKIEVYEYPLIIREKWIYYKYGQVYFEDGFVTDIVKR